MFPNCVIFQKTITINDKNDMALGVYCCYSRQRTQHPRAQEDTHLGHRLKIQLENQFWQPLIWQSGATASVPGLPLHVFDMLFENELPYLLQPIVVYDSCLLFRLSLKLLMLRESFDYHCGRLLDFFYLVLIAFVNQVIVYCYCVERCGAKFFFS